MQHSVKVARTNMCKKYFHYKIFPYIFHIKPLIFKTFSWSHSLTDFIQIYHAWEGYLRKIPVEFSLKDWYFLQILLPDMIISGNIFYTYWFLQHWQSVAWFHIPACYNEILKSWNILEVFYIHVIISHFISIYCSSCSYVIIHSSL
jgi:hypothetical protein